MAWRYGGAMKQKVISLDTKINAIIAVENGKKTKIEIAKDLEIPLCTLSCWLKQKDNILNQQNFSPSTKKMVVLNLNNIFDFIFDQVHIQYIH